MRLGKRASTNTGGQNRARMENCESCRGEQLAHKFSFCKTCVELLCQECRKNKHDIHITNTVDVVAAEVRKDASDCTSQTTQGKLGNVQQMEKLVQTFRDELLTYEAETTNRIKSHIGSLHRQLDNICDSLLQNVADVVREDLRRLQKIERDAKKLASSISSMCDSAKQISGEADDIITIRRGYVLCEELKEALQTDLPKPTRGHAFDTKFIPGTTDVESLTRMCGQVSTFSGQ